MSRQSARFARMLQEFDGIFGGSPQFFVRAPSYVSLIGRNGHHHGYPGVHVALENDVLIAVSTDETTTWSRVTRIAHAARTFAPASLPSEPSQIAAEAGWTRFFQGGYNAACDAGRALFVSGVQASLNPETAGQKVGHEGILRAKRLSVMVDTSAPWNSEVAFPGVTSAMTVASALATATANHFSFSRRQLVEISRKNIT